MMSAYTYSKYHDFLSCEKEIPNLDTKLYVYDISLGSYIEMLGHLRGNYLKMNLMAMPHYH